MAFSITTQCSVCFKKSTYEQGCPARNRWFHRVCPHCGYLREHTLISQEEKK